MLLSNNNRLLLLVYMFFNASPTVKYSTIVLRCLVISKPFKHVIYKYITRLMIQQIFFSSPRGYCGGLFFYMMGVTIACHLVWSLSKETASRTLWQESVVCVIQYSQRADPGTELPWGSIMKKRVVQSYGPMLLQDHPNSSLALHREANKQKQHLRGGRAPRYARKRSVQF